MAEFWKHKVYTEDVMVPLLIEVEDDTLIHLRDAVQNRPDAIVKRIRRNKEEIRRLREECKSLKFALEHQSF